MLTSAVEKSYGIFRKFYSVQDLKRVLKLQPGRLLSIEWANSLPKRFRRKRTGFGEGDKCMVCHGKIRKRVRDENDEKNWKT